MFYILKSNVFSVVYFIGLFIMAYGISVSTARPDAMASAVVLFGVGVVTWACVCGFAAFLESVNS